MGKIIKKQQEYSSISEVFDTMILDKRVSGIADITIMGYKDTLEKFYSVTGIKPDQSISYLSEKNVNLFTASMMDRHLKKDTINHYLRSIRVLVNYAIQHEYIEQFRVKLVRGQDSEKQTYTDEEINTLLEKPYTNLYVPWRSYTIICTVLATGMRCSTICSLQMQDVDTHSRVIHLRHTKSRKTQILPISDTLYPVLNSFIKSFRSDAKADEPFFASCDGTALTPNACKLAHVKYCQYRNISLTSIHALRHTFARYWIISGGGALELQKMLGHSTLTMTQHYVNLYSTDLAKAVVEHSALDVTKKTNRKHRTIHKR